MEPQAATALDELSYTYTYSSVLGSVPRLALGKTIIDSGIIGYRSAVVN